MTYKPSYRPSTTFINLFTTTFCNQKCKYCTEEIPFFETKKHIDETTFENALKFVDAQETENTEFHFYGGEALLHPNIFSMIDEVRQRWDNVQIKLSTNLNHPLDLIAQIPTDVYVYASLHTQYVGNYLEWYRNAKFLKEEGYCHSVRLMLDWGNETQIPKLYSLMKDNLNDVLIAPIDAYEDSVSFRHFRDYHSGGLFLEDNRGIAPCLCDAGFDIDVYGLVRKCSGWTGGILANVNKEQPKLKIWDICRHTDNCPCDEIFTKRSIS